MPQKQEHITCRLARLPIALAILVSLGGLPAAVSAQTQVLTAEEEPTKDDEGVTASERLPTHTIPFPCPNGVPWQRVCGSDVTLLRTIKKGTGDSDKRVGFLRPSASRYKETWNPSDSMMRVVESQDDDNFIFEVKISKTFLKTLYPLEPGETAPTDSAAYGISVFGQVGAGTCYWDCSYVNSVKKCQCIKF